MADKRSDAKRRSALALAGRRAIDFAFSRRCVMCGEALELYHSGELCAGCVGIYAAREAKRCPACRRSASDCACSRVRAENLGSGVTALGFYERADDCIGKMIYRLKREGSRDLTRFFARSLAERILRAEGLEASRALVTYPPRSVNAVWRYGFDHAKYLARMTAFYLGADHKRTLGAEGARSRRPRRERRRGVRALSLGRKAAGDGR